MYFEILFNEIMMRITCVNENFTHEQSQREKKTTGCCVIR